MTTIRFEPDGVDVEVPAGTSIRAAAEAAGAKLGSSCGGVCACSSCHVYVLEGLDDVSLMLLKEEDSLDKAFDVRPNSRLACQSELLRDRRYVVEITRESREAYFDEHPERRP